MSLWSKGTQENDKERSNGSQWIDKEAKTMTENSTNSPDIKLCASESALRQFLIRSRSLSDDQVKQRFNAWANDHSGQTYRREDYDYKQPMRHVDSDSCIQFVYGFLFPEWKSREVTLKMCGKWAETHRQKTLGGQANTSVEVSEEDEKYGLNPRINPYAFEQDVTLDDSDMIARTVANQSTVEEIVRESSTEFLSQRCGQLDWDAIWKQWLKDNK